MTDSPTPERQLTDTVRAIARLHIEHRRGAAPLQRALDLAAAAIGRPGFTIAVTLAILAWAAWNLVLAPAAGIAPFDPAPFTWLMAAAQLLALYVTLTILTRQRREDELAELREQLALELAILNEQKTAKIVSLLQELRRDIPNINDAHDAEAAAMASPADPEAIVAAIKTTLGEIEATHPEDGSTSAQSPPP